MSAGSILARAVAARLASPIDNVIADAKRFRSRHEVYLNDVPAPDVLTRLAHQPPSTNGPHSRSAPMPRARPGLGAGRHKRWAANSRWQRARSVRSALPAGTRLREILEFLYAGWRVDIDWIAQGNFVPHVPWGLLYVW